ncbi:MAG: asparagine synthase (glutamine-hydrolyzing), partial [Acidobacteria bacterium]|nr:asparagine synthase (glutamine-hydrolyzing) [Acidobacteriota bacterium]
MCGICGIVNFDPACRVETGLLKRMVGVLAHRGPDGEGHFLDANVGLGHRRLSVIDLQGGKQPILNEDCSAVIVFNGEIYNHKDLTAELSAKGHVFRTRSDTEAILHAYEEYGDSCVRHLRGMFAFAIWDRRRRRLFLARDRLGVKPLYFYAGKHCLAFASEIKTLLEVPSVPRELDRESLDLYLSLRFVPGPRTMFKGISKLQPGHSLVLDQAGVRFHKYWEVRFSEAEGVPFADHLEEFRSLLEESVKLRLSAEVPLGVFLSGGLDSSSILAITSRLKPGEAVRTFSVGHEISGFGEEEVNEFRYARAAAKSFGAEHHELKISALDFQDSIPAMVWHLDEPLADPSCIPLYFMSRLARRHVTVVLSGEGADETLAGYGIYKRMLLLDGLRRRAGPAVCFLASRLPGLISSESVLRYLRAAATPLQVSYQGVSRAFPADLKRRLLRGGAAGRPPDRLDELTHACSQGFSGTSLLNLMLHLDTKVWLPDDILLKADKMTMAHGLELRVPFLDHKLVEFAARLPPELKLSGWRGKFLLRQAMRDLLPQQIIARRKKGFPVPTRQWLRIPLSGFVRENLLARDSACRD